MQKGGTKTSAAIDKDNANFIGFDFQQLCTDELNRFEALKYLRENASVII